MVYVTVPQTNTRGLVENTKANEITMLKELGKTAVRNFGIRPADQFCVGRSERCHAGDCLPKTQLSANS